MEYDLSYDDSPSLKQTLADLLRGMSKKQAWQEVGQGIQNVAKVTPSVVESLGRGAIAQVPGTVGDISQLARQFAPETMQNVMGNRVAPTTEEILAKVPRLNPNYEGSSQHEMIGGLVSPAMPSLLRAGAKATEGMPIGNMIAYHGTPHEIKGAFDLKKVGTGEGAQAYGHGMYFAESPKVAETYAGISPTSGSYPPMRRSINGVEVEVGTPEAHAATLLNANGMTVKKAKDLVSSWINDPSAMSAGENTIAGWKKTLDTLNTINKKSDVKDIGLGNLYKVDIPDKDIPNMLDWDKPLREQSDVVRQALGLPEDKFAGFKVPATGTNYSFSPKMTGAEFYKELTDLAKTKAGATEMLNSMGVKGIRYLDEGSRDVPKYSGDIAYIHAGNDFKKHNYTLDDALSGMKQAYKNANVKELKDALNEVYGIKPKQTSNFVVFDPKEVKILEKNSKPVSRKEILEEQLNNIKK